jgi:hypothetical protein
MPADLGLTPAKTGVSACPILDGFRQLHAVTVPMEQTHHSVTHSRRLRLIGQPGSRYKLGVSPGVSCCSGEAKSL